VGISAININFDVDIAKGKTIEAFTEAWDPIPDSDTIMLPNRFYPESA
jgi:hypothetical protein